MATPPPADPRGRPGGVELKRRNKSQARFDMDGDGARDDTGWIGKGDGFLVVDEDGDGLIRSPGELSLLNLKKDSKSSFEALESLDSNRDGRIDSADARFAELKIWRDRNGNGLSDRGEVQGLADLGIASVGLDVRFQSGSAGLDANRVLAAATFTRADGSTGAIGSSALAYRPMAFGRAGGLAARAQQWQAELRGGRQGQEAGFRQTLLREPRFFHDGELPSAADAQGGAAAQVSLDRQDLPEGMPVSDDSPADSRVARIVQDMASFGARSGDAEWRRNSMTVTPSFDYFA